MKLDELGVLKVTLKGNMTDSLAFIYFYTNLYIVPTTIYFFNNGSWSNKAQCKTVFVTMYIMFETLIHLVCFV